MSHASCWAKAVAFIILVLVGFYAAHFTARIKIANEHVAFSRAAVLVPFSGTVGEFVTCTYGRLWNVKCTDPQGNEALKSAQAMNLPELQHLDLTVRYLCAADPVRQSLECSDRNMVGTAAILTALAEHIIATRPILAFTGSVIGYGILIVLAVIGLVGAMSAAATLARR